MKLFTHSYIITIYKDGKFCWDNKGWVKNNDGLGSSTIILLVAFVLMALVSADKAQAGTKTYLGMNYGVLDGCKATSFVGGQQLNEFISLEGSAVIDSTSCYRESEKIEIDSMIGVHLNLSMPTLNDDWYIEVSYGHTQLSRIGASSFGGSSYQTWAGSERDPEPKTILGP